MSKQESIIRKLKRIIGVIFLLIGAIVFVSSAVLIFVGLGLDTSDKVFATDDIRNVAGCGGAGLIISMLFFYEGYNRATGRKEELSDKLTTCPDCNNTVSKRAESCPHCGAPLMEDIANSGIVNAHTE